MTKEDIDTTIEKIMKEMRASPDYSGQSCSAQTDSHCEGKTQCKDSDNPKRLKKGLNCGVNPNCEQLQNNQDKV